MDIEKLTPAQILNLFSPNLLWPRLRSILARPSVGRWAAPFRTLRQSWGWRPVRIPLAEARSILVIRPDEIGDVVLSGPFLRELRRAAPRAHIALVVKTACLELVEHCPHVDAVHSLNFDGAGNDAHRLRLRWAAWRLRWRRVPRRGFDLVLLPRWDVDWYDSELVGHLLAGRGALVVHRDKLVKRSFHLPPEPPFIFEAYSNPQIEHEALYALRFLRWCGATDASDSHLEVWLTDADRLFARAWLDQHLTRRAPLVVIHPSGGSSRLKQWPTANFGALLNKLLADTSCDFLIVGGKDEGWITREFASSASERAVLAVGQFTLRQLSAVLEQARLFVGGDSGPMHLAAAAETPVIGIFGATSELRFRPWGRHCRVVSQRYACSPDVLGTFEDRCSTCRFPEPRCLTELSVEAVIAEVQSIRAISGWGAARIIETPG
jgi:ADP-heptose:LPS heptosyltransferase